MSKRAHGEGNIRQRADGRWEARLSFVDPTTGLRRSASFYGSTAEAVRAKLEEARDRVKIEAPVQDSSMKLADWLAHWRVTSLAVSNRKESTKALYANLSRKHLEPAPFGAIRLDKLRPSHVEGLILGMRAKTKARKRVEKNEEPDRVRALSDSTIRSTYAVLRAALNGAVRDALLARNPAALVKRPGVERHEARHLGFADITSILEAAEGSRYHAALVLIASTGLRRGECLALRWDSDILNLDEGWLKVRHTLGRIEDRLTVSEPKTDRARRTVPLSPALVALLRKHKATQAAEKLRVGDQWQNSGLVFTTAIGGPVDPRNLLRVVETAAAAAGVEGVDVHTLRHSAAVAWLEAGVHIKAVADLLGHSSIAITGDIYGHSSDATTRAAIEGLSDALKVAAKRIGGKE